MSFFTRIRHDLMVGNQFAKFVLMITVVIGLAEILIKLKLIALVL